MRRDKVLIEYLRKSYFTVDGLWFIAMEEEYSYEQALAIDEKVWQALPKNQARHVKKLLGIEGSTPANLLEALKVKFEAEGYNYQVENLSDDELKILIVDDCPWLRLLKKSNRTFLAPEISEKICVKEFEAWGHEFDTGLKFALPSRLCTGDQACLLNFSID